MGEDIVSKKEISSKEEVSLAYENKKQVFKGGLLGIFIGLAIIVPGVSGAAVAIIFGLYEKLLFAMGNVFKRFKKCFMFLLPIIIGGIVGIIGGFFGVKQLLNMFPFTVIALFAGLMFGSFPAISDQLEDKSRTLPRNILFILGIIIPIASSVISVVSGFSERRLYHSVCWLLQPV